jgi:hypothetical protein
MIQKQPVNINFSQGLETKTDPFQTPIGKFNVLQNSVFDKGGLLQKRNGFAQLTSLPDASSNFVTTFNDDLTAIGSKLRAYSAPSKQWVDKSAINVASLSVTEAVRNNLSQVSVDSGTSANGFTLISYVETDGTNYLHKYVVIDAATGQNIIGPIALTEADTVVNAARVFVTDNYFLIVYGYYTGATNLLRFIAVSTSDPRNATAPATCSLSLREQTILFLMAWCTRTFFI